MRPKQLLPLESSWSSEEEYVESLLAFVTGSDVLKNLCGGVHVLDFLTREPDLYSTVLPEAWRTWFEKMSIEDVLDFLLREDLSRFQNQAENILFSSSQHAVPVPPISLLEYVIAVRKHCLRREFDGQNDYDPPLPRQVAVGMKPKKIHEVSNLAAFIDRLSRHLCSDKEDTPSIVDFGSGQNYLGRTLASAPYQRDVIAIEQRHHNVSGAKGMDVHAKLAEKEVVMRNKKVYKKELEIKKERGLRPEKENLPSEPPAFCMASHIRNRRDLDRGSMTYIEHSIDDGQLEHILYPGTSSHSTSDASTPTSSTSSLLDQATSPRRPPLLVTSLHSCGNLSHHGLRSLSLTPSVRAVAIVGCCYNLLSERLGPTTYKHPQLRPNHPRLESTSNARDPHGFPMSRTLEEYTYPTQSGDGLETGLRLNITARMMAVQAPHNWGPKDSTAFFTRHFFRALLQKILADLGVITTGLPATTLSNNDRSTQSAPPDPSNPDTTTSPTLTIGPLPKSAFSSFPAYVHAALAKLTDPTSSTLTPTAIANLKAKTAPAILTPALVTDYESTYAPRHKKRLSILWSLMAFSAGVIESLIVVDRWLWLREQDGVDRERCWVEPVFSYARSPRNLVVVGVKRRECWK